jgi:hypothetical protein
VCDSLLVLGSTDLLSQKQMYNATVIVHFPVPCIVAEPVIAIEAGHTSLIVVKKYAKDRGCLRKLPYDGVGKSEHVESGMQL